MTSGRFFCSIEQHEGEDMFNYVRSVLGDDVLMYASDYPHSECQFPNSVDNILKWSSLKPDIKKKLLWDNAARFYKHDLDEPDEKLLAFAQSFEDKKGPPRGALS
jgi:predicted TIM-barrel fold metal-dependent hydrolase